uniref:FAM3 metabolism regulating signaling molecule B n=1 Tax=Latimeria chalumnae TaxID=7897 RepID=H3B5X4_LATCH
LSFVLSGSIKSGALLLACVGAWYLGALFAEMVPKDSVTSVVKSIKDLGDKPKLKVPFPKKKPCGYMPLCSTGNFSYSLLSGGGKEKYPRVCIQDELFLGAEKGNVERGINIAIVDAKTGKCVSTKFFDLWATDASGPMIEFIKSAPEGSLLLMVTHDEGSTKLTNDAKKVIEELGSKEIRNLRFRSSWAFIAAKGHKLPANIAREKINHSDAATNRYSGWPAEVKIDGCVPSKTN